MEVLELVGADDVFAALVRFVVLVGASARGTSSGDMVVSGIDVQRFTGVGDRGIVSATQRIRYWMRVFGTEPLIP